MMNVFNIADYGAVGDGKTLNTRIIQTAIDKCNAAGGGKVIIPDGVFMTGTLIMKSNVNLSVEAGGTLFASPDCGKYSPGEQFDLRPYPYNVILSGKIEDYGDYPDVEKKHVDTTALPRNRGCALIYAEEAENFSITGMGKIDANGTAFTEPAPKEANHYTPYRRINAPTPPRVVFLAGCRNVCIENISLVNSPAGWGYWIHDCDYITFDKVKILSDLNYPNNDGIHINCSRNVSVSNSCMICSDDCIVIRANSRSLKENKVCERVTVTNCTMTTRCAGVRIGFVNDGTIRNCVFSNIVMTDTNVGIQADFPDKELIQSDFGRECTCVENIRFSNIVMDKVIQPVKIRIGLSRETNVGYIKNLYFSGVYASCRSLPVIMGRDGTVIENICFSDCTFDCGGKDTAMNIEHVKNVIINNTRFSKI